jgi:hypothetical protein
MHSRVKPLPKSSARRRRLLVAADDRRSAGNSSVTDAAPPPDALAPLRAEVWRRYRSWERRLREERGIAHGEVLGHAEQASLDRFAVGKALT